MKLFNQADYRAFSYTYFLDTFALWVKPAQRITRSEASFEQSTCLSHELATELLETT